MGVERSVTRWHLQRQMILNEIASLEERLRQLTQSGRGVAQQAEQTETAALQQELSATQEKLRRMGACPKPMMG
jgi:primosomal protein N''